MGHHHSKGNEREIQFNQDALVEALRREGREPV
jgi:hypothetical protein